MATSRLFSPRRVVPWVVCRRGSEPNRCWIRPAWLVFFEPFTFLKPAPAYWAWATFNMLCLAAALFFLISDIGPPGADGWTVAALMLLYPPISINFRFAPSEVFLLLIFVLSLRALRRRNDATAGVLLAGAALLRAYPLGMLG